MSIKKKPLLMAVSLGLCSFSSFAEVSLELPHSIVMIMVNGEEANTGMMKAQLNKPTFTLPDGDNQIVFRFENMVRNSGGYEKYSSNAFIVKFNQTNEKLTLSIPEITSRDEAVEFNTKADYTITNQAGKNISASRDVLMSGGFQFLRDFDKEIYKYNQQDKVASLPSLNAKNQAALTKNNTESYTEKKLDNLAISSTTSAPESIKQLQQLFNQYDSETQKQFISWAVQNIK